MGSLQITIEQVDVLSEETLGVVFGVLGFSWVVTSTIICGSKLCLLVFEFVRTSLFVEFLTFGVFCVPILVVEHIFVAGIAPEELLNRGIGITGFPAYCLLRAPIATHTS